jgi:hypothetical protein
MATIETTVCVDVDLENFEDSELIEEMKYRGYHVSEKPEILSIEEYSIEHYWNQGNRKEALVLLERKFPELIGISKLID